MPGLPPEQNRPRPTFPGPRFNGLQASSPRAPWTPTFTGRGISPRAPWTPTFTGRGISPRAPGTPAFTGRGISPRAPGTTAFTGRGISPRAPWTPAFAERRISPRAPGTPAFTGRGIYPLSDGVRTRAPFRGRMPCPNPGNSPVPRPVAFDRRSSIPCKFFPYGVCMMSDCPYQHDPMCVLPAPANANPVQIALSVVTTSLGSLQLTSEEDCNMEDSRERRQPGLSYHQGFH